MIPTTKKGMTLIEVMVSLLLFSMIIISALSTVQYMSVARQKSINTIDLIQQLYFFSEQLFSEIKSGGTVDYEEYWNRLQVGTELIGGTINSTTAIGGHYQNPTGVGNFGNGGDLASNFGGNPYLCRSDDGERIKWGSTDCLKANFNNSDKLQSREKQRFGQYELLFIDYNGDANNDKGDQDKDGNIVDDEDDVNTYLGPVVFDTTNSNSTTRFTFTPELYLINKKTNVRTFFRWTITKDPNTTESCEITLINDNKEIEKISDGCLGNVQILKLKGSDEGWNHNSTGIGVMDGKIDTWKIQKGWGNSQQIATGQDAEWVDLFPKSITVKRLQFDVYPKKDPLLSVASSKNDEDILNTEPFLHPYVRISLQIGFSHGKRRMIRGDNPIISIPMTISLDDI